ncbi:hypothetical protein KTAU_24400 [Thermogemmatispora aurantia]|uniref:Uncharacterized protein n=1 Tax=Thermogemmatispora aurantia TaxID=2045279 RepID=A0A5J4K877_9CHLR|nr:hypothetical protein KTAU_24400 [Thermogemmatispora aurantia]
MIARGEDIGQEGKIILVLGPGWQLERIKVRIGYSQIFCLPTRIRPHCHITIGATSEAGIDGIVWIPYL